MQIYAFYYEMTKDEEGKKYITWEGDDNDDDHICWKEKKENSN